MTKKLARTGIFTDQPFYECKFDWPEDCAVQCGDGGIVFTKDGSYRTSFFEAFPEQPDTFLRGEGKTIEEAEEKAWKKFQKYIVCAETHGHQYEAREYENGAGYCKVCGLWYPDVIPPFHQCCQCGTPTWYHKDILGEWWCKTCHPNLPDDRKSDLDRMIDEMKRDLESH